MKVIIAGATGVVGKQILYECLSQQPIEQIKTLVRAPIPLLSDKKLEQIVVNWESPETWPELGSIDCAFCALGTTMKNAKTKEAFQKVDFDYAMTFAEKSKQAGAKTFVLVSAIGANSKSSIFYSRVKGQLEEALVALNFEYLLIAQPSLLIAPRKEKRIGEQLAQLFAPLIDFFMVGPLVRYHSITAELLGKSLVRIALNVKEYKGVERLSYNDFKKHQTKSNPWVKKGQI